MDDSCLCSYAMIHWIIRGNRLGLDGKDDWVNMGDNPVLKPTAQCMVQSDRIFAKCVGGIC